MVIFHSYVNVYQRVWSTKMVCFYIWKARRIMASEHPVFHAPESNPKLILEYCYWSAPWYPRYPKIAG